MLSIKSGNADWADVVCRHCTLAGIKINRQFKILVPRSGKLACPFCGGTLTKGEE